METHNWIKAAGSETTTLGDYHARVMFTGERTGLRYQWVVTNSNGDTMDSGVTRFAHKARAVCEGFLEALCGY